MKYLLGHIRDVGNATDGYFDVHEEKPTQIFVFAEYMKISEK